MLSRCATAIPKRIARHQYQCVSAKSRESPICGILEHLNIRCFIEASTSIRVGKLYGVAQLYITQHTQMRSIPVPQNDAHAGGTGHRGIGHPKVYLNNCVAELLKSLMQSDSGNEISDIIMRYKDEIVDMECLRKALKKWYKVRGVKDRSKQMIYRYRNKNLGLPEDVLQTLLAFHSAAG